MQFLSDIVFSGEETWGAAVTRASVCSVLATRTQSVAHLTLRSPEWRQLTRSIADTALADRLPSFLESSREDVVDALHQMVDHTMFALATDGRQLSGKEQAELKGDELSNSLIKALIKSIKTSPLGNPKQRAELSSEEEQQHMRQLVEGMLTKAYPNKGDDDNLPDILKRILKGRVYGVPTNWVPSMITGGVSLSDFTWDSIVDLVADQGLDIYRGVQKLHQRKPDVDAQTAKAAKRGAVMIISSLRTDEFSQWKLQLDGVPTEVTDFINDLINRALASDNSEFDELLGWMQTEIENALCIMLPTLPSGAAVFGKTVMSSNLGILGILGSAVSLERQEDEPEKDFSQTVARRLFVSMGLHEFGSTRDELPQVLRGTVTDAGEKQIKAQIDNLLDPAWRRRTAVDQLGQLVEKRIQRSVIDKMEEDDLKSQFYEFTTDLFIKQASDAVDAYVKPLPDGLREFFGALLKIVAVPIAWLSSLILRQRLWELLGAEETTDTLRTLIWNLVTSTDKDEVHVASNAKEATEQLNRFFEATGLLWAPSRMIVSPMIGGYVGAGIKNTVKGLEAGEHDFDPPAEETFFKPAKAATDPSTEPLLGGWHTVDPD